MRKILIFLLSLPMCTWGQLPSLTAAWSLGAAGYEQGFEVSVDLPGHIVAAGYFEATVDFDPGAGTQNRTSAGQHDIFVAKYTSAGAFEWAFRVGGAGYDQATGVDVDGAGNVFVSGYFTGNVDFDPGAGTTALNAGAADDAFLAKYSPTGAFLWAIRIGGSGYDMSNNCSTDPNGDVYITGHFVNTVDFNPGAGTNNLVSAGAMDMYLAKYSSAGSYLWAIRVGAGGLNDESGYDIATYGSDVYVTGLFAGTVDFDPGAGVVSRTGTGTNDIFLLKLSAAGAYQWVFTAGNMESDESTGVDVDGSGNVYLAGSFGQTVDFDPGLGVFNLTSNGVGDLFVAKYTAAGALTWVKQIGGVNNQHSWGMAVSPDGNTFFTGFHQGTADFDPNAGVFNITSAGSFDSYIASLDMNGNFRFAFPIGATNLDVGYGVDVNDACELGITGYFVGTTDMDPQAPQANLTSVGGFDIYLAVYGACSGPLDHETLRLAANALPDGRVALAFDPALSSTWQRHLERSPDGQTWTQLARLEAGETSSIDPLPAPGLAYYRLAAKDEVNAVRYSNTVSLLLEAALPTLYPSLASDRVWIDCGGDCTGARMDVHDSQGRKVLSLAAGDSITRLPVQGLPSGNYWVRIAGQAGSLRFVKE